MARACVFCGQSGVTKEHFFARWVRDEYSHIGGGVMEFGKNDSPEFSYSGNPLTQTAKAFCATCNNGWMNGLESKAASIVRPMLRGKIDNPITMGYAQQTQVASWATKTAFVLQQLHANDNHVPESYYRDFHRKQQPSSNVFVIMGTRKVAGKGQELNLFEYKERFVGTHERGIQHVHFVLGFVYFGIATFVGERRRFPLRMNDLAGEKANLIWPTAKAVVGWPTPPIDDVGGLDGMFDAFAGAFWGY